MKVQLNLESSIEHLYKSLINEDSFLAKALYIRFYVQFRADKKVDVEPVELCKFIFWKTRPGIDIQGLFSDDTLMDIVRIGKRTLDEKPIFVHNSSWGSPGEVVVDRLKELIKILSIQKKATFSIENIVFDKIFVFDLEPKQFSGGFVQLKPTYWQWQPEEKFFSQIEVKNYQKVTFLT